MGVFGAYTGSKEIAEDKKKEFNSAVKKILYYGGMMDIEDVSIYGCEINVLKPVELDSVGRFSFFFNYFEDDGWEDAGYNENDTYFFSNKIGNREFCDVVTAVHFLYEIYDDGIGCAQINTNIINSRIYLAWINHILGTEFSMKKRFRFWDNVEHYAFERLEYYNDDISLERVKELIPESLRYAAGGVELSDICFISEGTETLTEEEIEPNTYPETVYRCKQALYRYFDCHTDEDAVDRIWELIKMERKKRENIRDKALEEVAQMTLELPARVIVYLTAERKILKFWKVWKELKDDVYYDEKMKQYASDELEEQRRKIIEAPIKPVSTSEFLCQDDYFIFYDTPEELKEQPNYYLSDDDRLYWWDGTDEVQISKEMDAWLKELAERHKKIQKDRKKEEGNFQQEFVSVLAEISLFLSVPAMVYGYAYAIEENFWSVWYALDIKGYTDNIKKEKIEDSDTAKKESVPYPFYKVIQKKNEDEFIEFWDEEERKFSDDMKNCLKKWSTRYHEIKAEDTEGAEFTKMLADLIVDLDKEWNCRFVDKSFVEEFLEHEQDERYRKALILYRELLDADTEWFPELTKKQANRWWIKDIRAKFDFTAMSAYQSLMSNHKHRMELFGF